MRNRGGGRIVALVATAGVIALGIQAAGQPGFPHVPPTPSDRTQWIANGDRSLVGRMNPSSAQLDSALVIEGQARVAQDPFTGTVAVVNDTADELQIIDRTTVTVGSRIAIPTDAEVALGGDTIAIAHPGDGRVWTAKATEPAAADSRTAAERATVGPGPALAVTDTGVVLAVAARATEITRIGTDGVVSNQPIAGGGVADPQLSAIGELAVVLEAQDGSLRVGEQRFDLPQLADGLLQESGPAADAVVVATTTGLVAVSLADGTVQPLADLDDPTARPVVTAAGCVVAVADGTGVYACRDGRQDRADLDGRAFELVGRGEDIVVSDPETGAAWLAADDFREVTGWDQVIPPDAADPNKSDRTTETDNDRVPPPPPDCAGVSIGQPKALDDQFGIRAGRATVLRVLDNDPTTECTAVRISSVTELPASVGLVSIVDGGSALQITTVDDATGELPEIEYEVDNGRGDTATAAAIVRVAAPSVRSEPERIRVSATEVEAGGTTTYNVLADYRSPTGDDLYLMSAAADSGDEISFRPDGTVTFRSTGRGVGTSIPVQFVVSDGTARTTGVLTVSVAEPGTTTPISHPLQVSATVGRPVTVDPLRTLSTGAVRPVQIGKVLPQLSDQAATAIVDPGSNAIVVTSTAPGTYYFTFQVATGDRSTTGALRVDVAAGGERATVVPMVDVAFLPDGGDQLVDPLRNDADPGGRGLAVQSVSVPADGGVTASVQDLHQVLLSARKLPQPTTIDYEVFDGAVLATGQIRVVPVPAETSPPAPLAPPISMVVRAGDVATVPIDDHATAQDGAALTVSLDPVDVAAVPGVLFSTGSAIRYLAPTEVPTEPVVFGYTVTASTSTPTAPVRAGSTVSVTVVPASDKGGRPPVPPAPVVARVFAGGSIDVDLPVHAAGPDGDWVTVASLVPPEAPLGLAELDGTAALRYTALDKPGVDQLKYVIADSFGQTATAMVNVLVVPRVEVAGPPIAPDLTADVRPGRTVRIDPLESVYDPAGSRVSLADPAFDAPAGAQITVDDDALLLTAPAEETVMTLRYSVVNERGLRASGAIVVTVSATAADPLPLAGDILVPPIDLGSDATTVDVSVADHVTNRTGRRDELTLTVDPISAATAEMAGPLGVRVQLTDRRQVIAYHVTDAVGGAATAFLVVPPRDQLEGPQLTGTQIHLNAGTSIELALADHVSVAQGSPVLAEGYPVRITQGTVDRIDAEHLRITAPVTAGGAAVLYLPIKTESAVPTVLPIGVQIIPRDVPPPELDSVVLDVEVGTTETLDLGPLTFAFDDTQRRSLVWSAGAAGGEIKATTAGSVLSVTAPATTPRGTQIVVPVQAVDGENRKGEATVTVRVTGSRKPLATVVSQRVDRVQPGQTVSVDVLRGSSDPIGGGLKVSDLNVTQGAAGIQSGPSLGGSTLSLVPAAGFTGVIEVGFRVDDATKDPDRAVYATVTATVQDKPSRPGTPTVVEGSRTADSVRLSWAPSDPNGAPLTGYTVTGDGRTFSCDAASAACRIDGLTAGKPVTFTVVAHNEVGDSQPSGPSASVTPDALPVAPSAPTVSWVGRGVLDVNWSVPTGSFSAVTSMELQVLANGNSVQLVSRGTGTSYRAEGLDQGTTYTFQIRAINLEGQGPWSGLSAAIIPSGTPGAPAVQAAYVYDGSSGTVNITWSPPSDTGGERISGYEVRLDGSIVGNVGGDGGQFSAAVSGSGQRTVSVAATNVRGTGPGGTAAVQAWTRPTPPGSVTATPADGAIQVAWSGGSTPGSTIGRVEYNLGGGWGSLGDGTLPGLANGTTYTVQVRVCNAESGPEQATCSDGTSSNSVRPYGPPPAPTLNLTVADKVVTATWSFNGTGGRDQGAQTVTVSGSATATPGAGAGSWSQDVGWNATVTVVVKTCVTGPDECAQESKTISTAQVWTMSSSGVCGESSTAGGDWRTAADCGGNWKTSIEVRSCLSAGSYLTDPDAPPTVTVMVPSTSMSTSIDPGPPPTEVVTPVIVDVPTIVPNPGPRSNTWYLGTDNRYYRTVVVSGSGPPC